MAQQRNTKAHAAAITAASAKSKTIKQYGIVSDMTSEQKVEVTDQLANAKAKAMGVEVNDDIVSGQEWYLSTLIQYVVDTQGKDASETATNRYEAEYTRAFREYSTHEEGIDLIQACM